MTEHDLIVDVLRLMDENIVIDRSEKLLRPTITVVASVRLKTRDDDVKQFVSELRDRYPFARIVVGDKSPVEKAAGTAAVLYGMPFEFIKRGKKGEWDEDAAIRDERCVAAASHVVAFDNSARSQSYRKLTERMGRHFSCV